MEKIFKIKIILSTLILLLFCSSISYSSILKKDLKTKGTYYYYLDNLFEGKAIENRDRYYFKAGRANGKWLNFYKNGNLKSIINWKNGKLNGKYIIYLENGKKVSEVCYTDGKENGKYFVYFPNGQVRIDGEYSMGKPVGSWKFYDKFGKLNGQNNL